MFDLLTIEKWVNRARTAQVVADVVRGVADVVEVPGTAVLLVRDAQETVRAARESHDRGDVEWRMRHDREALYDDLGLDPDDHLDPFDYDLSDLDPDRVIDV